MTLSGRGRSGQVRSERERGEKEEQELKSRRKERGDFKMTLPGFRTDSKPVAKLAQVSLLPSPLRRGGSWGSWTQRMGFSSVLPDSHWAVHLFISASVP